MSRITSLSVYLENGTDKQYLAETYGKVIDNIAKETISQRFKNTDLSGDPSAGTVEAQRFVNVKSNTYGTARAGHAGQLSKVKPVVVPINVDRELIEEVEDKDVRLLGVEGFIAKKAAMQQGSMARELERAFFICAAKEGTCKTLSGSTALDKFEEMVQAVETVKNDFVDGVPRDMIHVVLSTSEYGALRNYMNTTVRNNAITAKEEEIQEINGVAVSSSTYLPVGVKSMVLVYGAIAQPVVPTIDELAKFPASNAYHFGLFYSYGTAAVMPDLIFYVADSLSNATLTIADATAAGKTSITPVYSGDETVAKWYYDDVGATAGTVPSYGDAVDTDSFTEATLTSGAFEISSTNNNYIIVVGTDANGKIICGNQGKAVVS